MENIIEEELNEKKPQKKGWKNIVLIVVLLIISFTGAFLIGKTLLKNGNSSGEINNELGPLYISREFTVNLADSNGRRFLKAQFSLEFEEKKAVDELERILPVFEDKVIMVLSSQTMESLNSANGREKMKNQLIENINEILTTGEVKNIYFNNIVWQ